MKLHFEEGFIGFYTRFVPRLIFSPFGVASVARIGNHVFRVFLKHFQTHSGPDDSEVVVMNISSFCGSSCFHHMTERASAGSPGLWGIVVLGMDPNGPRIGELVVFAMTREAKVVVVIGPGQLRSAGSSMRIVTVKTQDPGIEMAAFLKVEPLLVVGFRMGLRLSPASGFKLIIIG